MAKSFELDEGFNTYDINERHLDFFSENEELMGIHKNVIRRRAFYIYNSAKLIIKSEIITRFKNAHLDINERGRILFLHGDYNSGKSYLLRYGGALCKRFFESKWKTTDDGRTTHPIIIKNFPYNIRSVEGLYTWMLEVLGNPVDPQELKKWEKTKLKIIRLQKKVIKTLNAYETRLLILDESQRLLRAGDNLRISEIFEAFKDLTTKNNWDEIDCRHRPHIVLCGTSDCLALLRMGKFIQGRVHTRQLYQISQKEYPNFLATIYSDYRSLGISSEWNLFHEENNSLALNEEIALVLYERTKGMAGLTVEIIREAVLSAFEAGLGAPTIDHYKEVILEGTKYVFQKAYSTEKDGELSEFSSEKEKHPSTSIKVNIDEDNLICAFRGCSRSKKPYKRVYSLINHYNSNHPEAEVYDSEGNRLDNN